MTVDGSQSEEKSKGISPTALVLVPVVLKNGVGHTLRNT